MTDEVTVRTTYARSQKDKTKMNVAFWWCVVKLVLVVLVLLATLAYPGMMLIGLDKTLESYTSGLIVTCLIDAFFVFGTNKIRQGEWRNCIAFGVCDLIFCSLVAGILMLCCKKDGK